MGASSQEFIDFVLGQLDSLPRLTAGPFFGGIGIKSGPTQFAMLMDGSLYFTVNDASRTKYEQMGSSCFSYDTKKGRVEVRKYFEVPADLIEDPSKLLTLAAEAIEIAHKFSANPTPRKRKPAKA